MIFINDIDIAIISSILKFTDDTIVFSDDNHDQDGIKLQDELNKLSEWSHNWQMLFNVKKFKNHAFLQKESHFTYIMNRIELECTKADDLKVAAQCMQAYKKANIVLGMINRVINFKSKAVLLILYKSLVRPHLEYCTPAWSPNYEKDKSLLKKVQHQFIRKILGLNALSYEDRLDIPGLWLLE